jgi:hypothetical protein
VTVALVLQIIAIYCTVLGVCGAAMALIDLWRARDDDDMDGPYGV